MADLRFDGRVAVVTGAGRGLGREHALLLAARGAKVVVNDPGGAVDGTAGDGGPAEDVAREIRDAGGWAVADTHSVATPEGGDAIVGTAVEAFGRLDVLVNNAGIVRDAPFDDMTPDRLEPLLDVHLRGAFHVTRPAWALMRAQGYGRIVNTTSAAGVLGVQNMTNYGSAKTGMIGLTRCLGIEGEPLGITVNAVAPVAATRMLEKSLASADPGGDPELAAMLERVAEAFEDKLEPRLVSSAVAFLAHEECPVTGEIYSAGGGQVSRFFIGRTRGFHDPELTIEGVRDHFAQIRDEAGYTVPGHSGDEMASLFDVLGITRD